MWWLWFMAALATLAGCAGAESYPGSGAPAAEADPVHGLMRPILPEY